MAIRSPLAGEHSSPLQIGLKEDTDPYGHAENQDFAFKGPLLKGAVTEGDWGIRVRITHNLNTSYFLALSPLPCFARLPPLKRGALKAELQFGTKEDARAYNGTD